MSEKYSVTDVEADLYYKVKGHHDSDENIAKWLQGNQSVESKVMVNEILEDRGKVYGDFSVNLNARADIMSILDNVSKDKTGLIMDYLSRQAINDIVIKLVRLAATPDHIDSWEDTSNYARLNVERLSND